MYIEHCNQKQLVDLIKMVKQPIKNIRITGLPSSAKIDMITDKLTQQVKYLKQNTNIDSDSIDVVGALILWGLTSFSTIATQKLISFYNSANKDNEFFLSRAHFD